MQVVTSVALLIGGTGSIFPLDNASQWGSYIGFRILLPVKKTNSSKSNIDIRTPKEHLENIRSVLNPPIADLAGLFSVSRQAIYKWLAENSYPEDDKLEMIKTLSKVADMFKSSGVLRTKNLLHMENPQGVSLLDLIKNKEPIEQQMKLLIAEAQVMEISYQRSGLAQSKATPTNDWMTSMSIPAYLEDL